MSIANQELVSIIDSRLRASQGSSSERLAFIPVAFLNSWTNFGAPYVQAGYARLGDLVFLRGVISSGTVGSPAFKLPGDYAPKAQHIFAVISAAAIGRVDVAANGEVQVAVPSSNTWLSLNGICYSTR